MPRKLWIPLVAAGALVLFGAAGAYAYFFSGLRSTPSAQSLPTPMTDFGVSPPSIGFTTVQPAMTIEFSLNLTQGS